MLKNFLKNELAGKYEVLCRYNFRKNSIIIEMRDGLLFRVQEIFIDDVSEINISEFDHTVTLILRNMMQWIDEYRKEHEIKKNEQL